MHLTHNWDSDVIVSCCKTSVIFFCISFFVVDNPIYKCSSDWWCQATIYEISRQNWWHFTIKVCYLPYSLHHSSFRFSLNLLFDFAILNFFSLYRMKISDCIFMHCEFYVTLIYLDYCCLRWQCVIVLIFAADDLLCVYCCLLFLFCPKQL